MSEHPAAPLLAERLGSLRHTNAHGEIGHVKLAGFSSTAGMSEEQAAEMVGALGLAIAEGVIETLREDCGHDVVPTAEVKALRKKAAQASGEVPEAPISKCKRCGKDVLRPGQMIDVPTTIKALQAHVIGNCLP